MSPATTRPTCSEAPATSNRRCVPFALVTLVMMPTAVWCAAKPIVKSNVTNGELQQGLMVHSGLRETARQALP